MNEVLTVAEIKSKYDSEWVLIEDPQTNEALEQKTFEEKPGDSFGRFQKALKKMLSIPKEEIDKREAEYQRTKKTPKKRG